MGLFGIFAFVDLESFEQPSMELFLWITFTPIQLYLNKYFNAVSRLFPPGSYLPLPLGPL